ncbi:MAG: TIGR02186 family protein [Candidatus Kapaibacteriales bacterium]
MSVKGVYDPVANLIIKLTSPYRHEILKCKCKVGGILWMNMGTLEIKNVPGVYFLYSTKKIEDILSAEEAQRHVIGYPALQNYVEINPVADDAEKAKWFKEFVKFKEHSRLYSTSTGKISLTQKDGKGNYYIKIEWPYQVPPGKYDVTVYAVKNEKVSETAQSSIIVEQVGVVKTLADMAKNNGAIYGIISIVVAIVVGFGVGMIFRKRGGAH